MRVYAVKHKDNFYGVYVNREHAERLQHDEIIEINLTLSWHDTMLQMARLICELQAAGGFGPDDGLVGDVMSYLEESMDLTKVDIDEIVEDATMIFDTVKSET